MMAGCDWVAGFRVALGSLEVGAGERQEMGWGGGLILSKAQKSATAPAHLLLACAVSELAKSPNAVLIACRNGLTDSKLRCLGSGCGG